MAATERETAAFWLGFGAALRGAFGRRALEATSYVLERRILPGATDRMRELLELLDDLPGSADDEIRGLFAQLGGGQEEA